MALKDSIFMYILSSSIIYHLCLQVSTTFKSTIMIAKKTEVTKQDRRSFLSITAPLPRTMQWWSGLSRKSAMPFCLSRWLNMFTMFTWCLNFEVQWRCWRSVKENNAFNEIRCDVLWMRTFHSRGRSFLCRSDFGCLVWKLCLCPNFLWISCPFLCLSHLSRLVDGSRLFSGSFPSLSDLAQERIHFYWIVRNQQELQTCAMNIHESLHQLALSAVSLGLGVGLVLWPACHGCGRPSKGTLVMLWWVFLVACNRFFQLFICFSGSDLCWHRFVYIVLWVLVLIPCCSSCLEETKMFHRSYLVTYTASPFSSFSLSLQFEVFFICFSLRILWK